MITVEQCRAARGLLGWTQQNLATAAKMSKTAVNNFERSLSNPTQRTLRTIQESFEKAGIELIVDQGVKWRNNPVQVFKGPDCQELLLEDIYNTLKEQGGEVLVSSVDEKSMLALGPEKIADHFDRLKKISVTRMLTRQNNTVFIQPKECYRWISPELYDSTAPTFVYGKKVAIKLWKADIIIVLDSIEASDAGRQRFEYIWENVSAAA